MFCSEVFTANVWGTVLLFEDDTVKPSSIKISKSVHAEGRVLRGRRYTSATAILPPERANCLLISYRHPRSFLLVAEHKSLSVVIWMKAGPILPPAPLGKTSPVFLTSLCIYTRQNYPCYSCPDITSCDHMLAMKGRSEPMTDLLLHWAGLWLRERGWLASESDRQDEGRHRHSTPVRIPPASLVSQIHTWPFSSLVASKKTKGTSQRTDAPGPACLTDIQS